MMTIAIAATAAGHAAFACAIPGSEICVGPVSCLPPGTDSIELGVPEPFMSVAGTRPDRVLLVVDGGQPRVGTLSPREIVTVFSSGEGEVFPVAAIRVLERKDVSRRLGVIVGARPRPLGRSFLQVIDRLDLGPDHLAQGLAVVMLLAAQSDERRRLRTDLREARASALRPEVRWSGPEPSSEAFASLLIELIGTKELLTVIDGMAIRDAGDGGGSR